MSRIVTDNQEVSSHPVSYDSGYSAYSVSGLTNAYTDSSSTTYATINLTRGSSAETYIYYNFSFNIPTGATIDAITCTAKCYISNTNSRYINTRQIQLYSGSTAMGSAHTVSNSTTAFSMTPGTWTASQLNNAKIRLYAKRATSNTNTNYYFRFYGATFTVKYTYQYVLYTVTATSNVSGVTVSPASQEYRQGENASVNIYGFNNSCIVTDNSVDVTSLITAEDPAKYIINNISNDHAVIIDPAAQSENPIFIKLNNSWVKASNIYAKIGSRWREVNKVYTKVNGIWVEESDRSAMFSRYAVYLNKS